MTKIKDARRTLSVDVMISKRTAVRAGLHLFIKYFRFIKVSYTSVLIIQRVVCWRCFSSRFLG